MSDYPPDQSFSEASQEKPAENSGLKPGQPDRLTPEQEKIMLKWMAAEIKLQKEGAEIGPKGNLEVPHRLIKDAWVEMHLDGQDRLADMKATHSSETRIRREENSEVIEKGNFTPEEIISTIAWVENLKTADLYIPRVTLDRNQRIMAALVRVKTLASLEKFKNHVYYVFKIKYVSNINVKPRISGKTSIIKFEESEQLKIKIAENAADRAIGDNAEREAAWRDYLDSPEYDHSDTNELIAEFDGEDWDIRD